MVNLVAIGAIHATGDDENNPTPRNGADDYVPDVDAEVLADLLGAGSASALDQSKLGMFANLVPEWRTMNNLMEQDLSSMLGKRDNLKQKDLSNLSD